MADMKETIPERFRVSYQKETGAFRILDCWNETVRNISDLTTDIPDSSPAVKIITALELNALLGKLKEMGWIEKLFGDNKEHLFEIASTAKPKEKDLKQIAIEKLTEIVLSTSQSSEADETVAKEAIAAIREITGKV